MGKEPHGLKGAATVSALRAEIEQERNALSDEVAELDRRRHAAFGWTRKLGGKKGVAIAVGVGAVALVAGAFLLRRSPAARVALAVGRRGKPWLSSLGRLGVAAATAYASKRRGDDLEE